MLSKKEALLNFSPMYTKPWEIKAITDDNASATNIVFLNLFKYL